MWSRFKAWLIGMSDVYPPRWYWPVVRIYGGPEGRAERTVYMTRVLIGPKTRWGQCYLHVFHRSDIDRDPHDHPFGFWTLPLNDSYIEEVFVHERLDGIPDKPQAWTHPRKPCFMEVTVPRLRWTYRASTHTHRVDRTASGRWPLVTLVWRGPTERSWGFWCHDNSYRYHGMPASRFRRFVPWKEYVFEGQHANEQGDDIMCPGGGPRVNPKSNNGG